MLKILQRIIFGGSSRLRDHEVALLRSVERELPVDQADALREQLGAIELVKRHLKGRRVTMNFFGEKRQRLKRLSGNTGERKLARLDIEAKGWTGSVTVVLYDGLLSSLEFTSPPPKILELVEIKTVRVY